MRGDLDELRALYDQLNRRPFYSPRENLTKSPFAALNLPATDLVELRALYDRHFDLPIHVASIPTKLNPIPGEILDALKVRYPGWRSGFSLQSVVVKWKDISSETDLIRLNRAQKGTAFKRMEENKWLDMVEIKYKRN
jgi:hypothetical protein